MITKLVSASNTSWGYYDDPELLDKYISEAIEEIGRPPDDIHFSSSQATSSGGQNYHYAALLVWTS
jgi:hypothetical protein